MKKSKLILFLIILVTLIRCGIIENKFTQIVNESISYRDTCDMEITFAITEYKARNHKFPKTIEDIEKHLSFSESFASKKCEHQNDSIEFTPVGKDTLLITIFVKQIDSSINIKKQKRIYKLIFTNDSTSYYEIISPKTE